LVCDAFFFSSAPVFCSALLWAPICTFFGNKEIGKWDGKSKEVLPKKNQVPSVQRDLFFWLGKNVAKVAIF
jgi:hypothetical protein